MEKTEVILITGIIAACIWMAFAVLLEGRNRKRVITAGIGIDAALFIFCRSWEMLLIGFLGGIACGLIPGLGRGRWQYEQAVREMNGVKNWIVVSVIFFVMIFMTIAIAYPKLAVTWR